MPNAGKRESGQMSFVNSIITTQGLRHQNRAIVLNCIREFGALAHTDIGEKTRLASGTVSVITGEFLAEGVLEKVEYATAKGRGRPRNLFTTRAGFSYIVLVRVSAEKVEYSLVDYCATLLDRQTIPRDPGQTNAEVFKVNFKVRLREFIARSRLAPPDIKVISVTTKGEVDEISRVLIWSPIFGSQQIDFRELLAPDWRATVTLTNEIGFLAHNIMQKTIKSSPVSAGARQAVLSLSDSIGLGVATLNDDGEIKLSAPAFGHMAHEMDGPLCRCGAHGCLETYAGFNGILRTAFDGPKDGMPAKFIPLDQMRRMAKTARQGNRAAAFAFRQAGMVLGMCLSRMFNVLGAMPLTIVGAGLEFYDLIQDGLEDQLNDNFLVRIGQSPKVTLWPNETELAFESNTFVSLRAYDRSEIATRRYLRDN